MLSTCLSSHSTHQSRIGLYGCRQRTRTGHTNRWQLALPQAGDLLGQSQVNRAMRLGMCRSTPHRSTGSEDTLQQQHDDPPNKQPPPLHDVSPTDLCSLQNIKLSQTPANPEYTFYIVSQEVVQCTQPDAVLECLGSIWELHWPYLSESETLAELYMTSQRKRLALLQERTESCVTEKCLLRGMRLRPDGGLGRSRGSLTRPILLQLNIDDPSVTKESLSFALMSMYRRDDCAGSWCESVLCTATLLRLLSLKQRCVMEMISRVSVSTVCDFHRMSCKYKQVSLQQTCERWLELFLVTELSQCIELRDLTFHLLLKTLQSPRVFTSNEYELLRTVLYWIYLQINTEEHTLPSHSAIIDFFCRSSRVFLEQPLGQSYTPLFQCLRLHGVTEPQHMEEMLKIKVFPQSRLLLTLSNLVCSIHNGGNMRITNFTHQAVRFGMTVTGEHCTRTVGLYGFYFLLKASRVGESEAIAFSIERLRHWDPALPESCRAMQPFSMRSERSVCYQISVQSRVCGEWQERSSGQLSHVFGLSKRCSRSQVFTVDGVCVPALVTFSLICPSP